jgi:hypothetical protein
VLVDRANTGGNETGQQSNFASKDTRPQDAVWTIDGIVITDMAATGAVWRASSTVARPVSKTFLSAERHAASVTASPARSLCGVDPAHGLGQR